MAQLLPAPVIAKSPNERRIVEIGWIDLLPESVTIATSSWTVTGDATLAGPVVVGDVTRVRIDGGTLDLVAQLVNLVELSNGERLEACITVYVRAPCAEGC